MKTNQLSVDSDKKREQWIDLLYSGVNFHKAMALEMKSEILTVSEEMNQDELYHTALANAIREAIWLIEEWEIEDESTTDSND